VKPYKRTRKKKKKDWTKALLQARKEQRMVDKCLASTKPYNEGTRLSGNICSLLFCPRTPWINKIATRAEKKRFTV